MERLVQVNHRGKKVLAPTIEEGIREAKRLFREENVQAERDKAVTVVDEFLATLQDIAAR